MRSVQVDDPVLEDYARRIAARLGRALGRRGKAGRKHGGMLYAFEIGEQLGMLIAVLSCCEP